MLNNFKYSLNVWIYRSCEINRTSYYVLGRYSFIWSINHFHWPHQQAIIVYYGNYIVDLHNYSFICYVSKYSKYLVLEITCILKYNPFCSIYSQLMIYTMCSQLIFLFFCACRGTLLTCPCCWCVYREVAYS